MYRIFDVMLDCNIDLPELVKVFSYSRSEVIKVFVQQAQDNTGINKEVKWYHHYHDRQDNISISCGHHNNDYCLAFPDLAHYIISGQLNHVTCLPVQGVPQSTIRHLLLDQVIPRILGQKGQLVIHASAVVLPGNSKKMDANGILFIGHSGWGKSTMASAFHHKWDARLVTDDCLLLNSRNDALNGIANYYGLRLFEDSANTIYQQQYKLLDVSHYTEKKRLLMGKESESETEKIAEIRVNAIVFLPDPERNNSEGISVRAIKGHLLFETLIQQLFMLDMLDKTLMLKQFINMGKLISSSVKFYALEYQRSYENLFDVMERLNTVILEENGEALQDNVKS